LRDKLYRIKGIILRRKGDIVSVLSPEGKMRLLAKGAGKPQAKKTGHIETLSLSSLLILRGREMDIITQAEMLSGFEDIKEDPKKLYHALLMLELADRLFPEGEGGEFFEVLLTSLKALSSKRPEVVDIKFKIEALRFSGYMPEIYKCPGCGKELHDGFIGEDGIYCEGCGEGERLSREEIGALRFMEKTDIARLPDINDNLIEGIKRFLDHEIKYILEDELKTQKFIRYLSP